MNPVLKYTKAQYLGKIQVLEGQYSRLQSHLETMEGYKEKINSFWHDDKAKDAYAALNKQIQNLRTAMEQCNKTLIMYKEIVEQMEGTNITVSDLLGDAVNAVNLLK